MDGGGGGAPGSWGWDGVSPVQSECELALSRSAINQFVLQLLVIVIAMILFRMPPLQLSPSIHPQRSTRMREWRVARHSPFALVGYWFYGVVQQHSKLHWSAHTKVESISVHWQSICRSNLAQSGQARDTTQMELTSSGPSRRRGLVGES